MKVYVLTRWHRHNGDSEVLDVYDRPKTARLWLEKKYGIETKNKWTKMSSSCRFYSHEKWVYYVDERPFRKGKIDG